MSRSSTLRLARRPDRKEIAVNDIEDLIDRLRQHGAEPIGELMQYENSYRLCYLRGPAGILVALAEQTG
jgi:hypothetical protein